MSMSWNWLYVPYAANILILVPVCYHMIWGGGVGFVFEGKVTESEGLRLLVASLWSAILFASIAGFFFPSFLMPIIFAQVFYKAMWLITYSFPKWQTGGMEAFPAGISWCFVLICLSYPVFVALHLAAKGN